MSVCVSAMVAAINAVPAPIQAMTCSVSGDAKALVDSPSIVVVLIPEADQGVGAETHALPADKHEQQVIGRDKDQHGGRKEIEKSKEAPERFVLVHVAGGVDMDQAADTGDHQDHHGGKRIHPKSHIHFERSEIDPGIKPVDEKSLFGCKSLEGEKRIHGKSEGKDDRRAGNEADRSLAHPFLNRGTQQAVDNGPDQREENNPAKIICLYWMIHN